MNSARRILVTGADGFIGSHLTEKLVRAGHEVRAFIYYNASNNWGWLENCASDVKSNFEPVLGDVRDPVSIRSALKGCDLVIHLAALIGIPYSYLAAPSYVDTNIMGTLNILEAMREFEVSQMIHTSTSEVYGSARTVPINEDHPLSAQSPYAASKIGADQLALSYHRSFATPVTLIRPFNTYGPRQSARAIIPTIISQALSGTETLKLGSLTPTRDFNFVSDVVAGFVAALDRPETFGEMINLGTGYEVSIGDAVAVVAEACGVTAQVEVDEQRVRPVTSEVDRLCADNGKAKRLLEWAPNYCGLVGFKRGIAETVAWFKEDANRDCYKSNVYAV